jgi:hypothetical protein
METEPLENIFQTTLRNHMHILTDKIREKQLHQLLLTQPKKTKLRQIKQIPWRKPRRQKLESLFPQKHGQINLIKILRSNKKCLKDLKEERLMILF